MKESVRSRKRYSMKWRLVGILLLCWLIPFSVMFGVMVVYVASNNGAETAENFRNQLEFKRRGRRRMTGSSWMRTAVRRRAL